jgi:hypothetical protein
METDGDTTKRVIHFRDAVVVTCNAVLFTRLPLVSLNEGPFGRLEDSSGTVQRCYNRNRLLVANAYRIQ